MDTVKVRSVSELVPVLKTCSRLVYLSGNANHIPIVEQAIQEKAEELNGLRFFQILTLGRGWDTVAEHIRLVTPFIGPGSRRLANEGKADFVPTHLSQLPALFSDGRWRPEVAIVQTSMPDENGRVTLGLDAGLSYAAFLAAGIRIAVMNRRMPRFHIEPFLAEKGLIVGMPVNLRDIHYVLEIDEPLVEHPMGESDEVSERIGKLIAREVPNGATLQLGIGGIPNAVLNNLLSHEDIGIHTEVISDGLIRLIEEGVVTGREKALLRKKVVLGFVLGTQALYGMLEGSQFAFLPQEWVNNPTIIGRNRFQISINSALAVNLFGDVSASTIGRRWYSGVGGARDFALGANMSEGGKSFIALPSTYERDGTAHSRILAEFLPGTHVTTSSDTMWNIVTEYGIAKLRGMCIRSRAAAIISIAHPDFRDRLLDEARRLPGLQGLVLSEADGALVLPQ